MYRLTTISIALSLSALGIAVAQEAPVYGLDYNPPIVRTGHDSNPNRYTAPGRQVRGYNVINRANISGAVDTRTTASSDSKVNRNHQAHRPYGNYGPQVTEWEMRSGR